jgi:hypothetical protein
MNEEYTWDIDGMHIHVYRYGVLVISIFLGEAIEACPRLLVESHIQEIERTPWIKEWHDTDQYLFPE